MEHRNEENEAVPDSVAIGVASKEGTEKTNKRLFAFAIEIQRGQANVAFRREIVEAIAAML